MMSKIDSEIQQAVLDELRWDTRVRATQIGVEVDAGVVTLTGNVGSWAERVAAQEAAHRVRAVLDVANDIEVKLPGNAQRTDAELAAQVRHALEWNVLVPSERISSTVSDGWVTLQGEVDYWSQREDTALGIKNIAGVRGVTNKIDVKPPNVFPQDVQRAIEDALSRRAQRAAGQITVAVQHDTVRLSGAVRSLAERELAVGAAKGTMGVKRVEDDLRIEPGRPEAAA
jgi:osmotically-inducible protein OsmY